jgi:hypothetical protein
MGGPRVPPNALPSAPSNHTEMRAASKNPGFIGLLARILQEVFKKPLRHKHFLQRAAPVLPPCCPRVAQRDALPLIPPGSRHGLHAARVASGAGCWLVALFLSSFEHARHSSYTPSRPTIEKKVCGYWARLRSIAGCGSIGFVSTPTPAPATTRPAARNLGLPKCPQHGCGANDGKPSDLLPWAVTPAAAVKPKLLGCKHYFALRA